MGTGEVTGTCAPVQIVSISVLLFSFYRIDERQFYRELLKCFNVFV